MSTRLITAITVGLAAVLGTPVLASSVEQLNFSGDYGQYFGPVVEFMPLLLALTAFVYIGMSVVNDL